MGKKIGIDLGTSNTLIYIEGEDIVSQVSAVAVEEDSGKLLAAGNEAVSLCGRIPGAAHLEYPFRSGADIHSESFVYYMRRMLETAGKGRHYRTHRAALSAGRSARRRRGDGL